MVLFPDKFSLWVPQSVLIALMLCVKTKAFTLVLFPSPLQTPLKRKFSQFNFKRWQRRKNNWTYSQFFNWMVMQKVLWILLLSLCPIKGSQCFLVTLNLESQCRFHLRFTNRSLSSTCGSSDLLCCRRCAQSLLSYTLIRPSSFHSHARN